MGKVTLDDLAEAAHDAWLLEKTRRLQQIHSDEMVLSWRSEGGEEQLVPWSHLSEPVREFDRIVVRAILDVINSSDYKKDNAKTSS